MPEAHSQLVEPMGVKHRLDGCFHATAGEARGKSLQGKDDPVVWYEAAKALAPLPNAASASLPGGARANDALLDAMRERGEALLETEAQVFERDLGKRNSSDARWLQQVKRSGTTSDKIAATTLLVQVREASLTSTASVHVSSCCCCAPEVCCGVWRNTSCVCVAVVMGMQASIRVMHASACQSQVESLSGIDPPVQKWHRLRNGPNDRVGLNLTANPQLQVHTSTHVHTHWHTL